MKIIETISGYKVEVYSARTEAPIRRYNELQKFMVINSGIGSTIEAIDERYSRIAGFIAAADTESALKEAENARHATLSALNGINYGSLAFATLTTKITAPDGKETLCNDITPEGLQRTVVLLEETEISMQEILDEIEDFKKKL